MKKIKIATIISTHNRPAFLANRSLRSVITQTRKPNIIIVVDDSDKKFKSINQEIVATINIDKCSIIYLENYRNPGMCGALNTALTHLTLLEEEERTTYVAILDDDDEWKSEYLKECEEAALSEEADIVVSGLVRLEKHGEQALDIAKSYTQAQFLEGNPHWQGSNTFISLSAILRAGAFDENMHSTNDRDLAIRLLDIPSIKWCFIHKHLVLHHADDNNNRLSLKFSQDKRYGLQTFYDKHQWRMTYEQRKKHIDRAKKYFGCKVRDGYKKRSLMPCKYISKISKYELKLIVIGAIASPEIDVPIKLLKEIETLAKKNISTKIHLLFMPNYVMDSDEYEHMEKSIAENESKNLYVKQLERIGEDGDKGKLSIAEARSALHLGCYEYIQQQGIPVGTPVWILDDDARLTVPVDAGNAVRIKNINHIAMIAELKQTGADVIIGSVCGAPPLPFASTIRVQLLDLFYNLCRISGIGWNNPEKIDAPYEFDYAHNMSIRNKYSDFYYDLSRADTGHLETPFWYEPRDINITFGQAVAEISSRLGRLFAGEQVFRQLLWQNVSLVENLLPQFNRGPNTVIFNHEALKQIPNIAPRIDGKFTRRSDMNWAILCHFIAEMQVKSAPLPIYQDRADIAPKWDAGVDTLIGDTLVNDIKGYAITSALRQTFITARARNQRKKDNEDEVILLDYSGERLNEAKTAADKFFAERLKSFELSYRRIIGLLEALVPYCVPQQHLSERNIPFWHLRPEYKESSKMLTDFYKNMRSIYSLGNLNKFLQQTNKLNVKDVHAFFRDLRCQVALYRGKL